MRILDLFCGAGGAAMGLHQAFPEAEIVGVDIKPQPRYPFKFVQGDVFETATPRWILQGFDFVWASPPCQGYSEATPLRHRDRLPKLIGATRELLHKACRYYVIENVENARNWLRNPSVICGTALGLNVWRHRYFETDGDWVIEPLECKHAGRPVTLHCGSNTRKSRRSTSVKDAGRAMGIDWVKGKELNEAIPPAYSRYIGEQFKLLRQRADTQEETRTK